VLLCKQVYLSIGLHYVVMLFSHHNSVPNVTPVSETVSCRG
jgi:hypothetical protein